MKHFLILLVLVGFFGTVYAAPPPDPIHAFNYSEHVIIGEILSVEKLSEPKRDGGSVHAGFVIYEIKVDAYLKNSSDDKIIKVPGYYVNELDSKSPFNLLFEVEQKVILYLQKDISNIFPDYELIIRDRPSQVINGEIFEFLSNIEAPVDLVTVYQKEISNSFPSPLKQFKSGISFDSIQCKENLVLIQKFDGSPACVMYQTGEELVKRGWVTCDDGINHGRGHPCGPRSSGVVGFDKESYKPVYPKFDGVTEIINPEHESLEYRATSPIIDDTYLLKNVQQWKDAWEHEMQAEYEKYGDEFYIELGRLLMKNEMQYQMNNLGIVNSEEDFKVVSGMMLTSLPPHIGFSSIIHATDDHYYWLQGTTHANQVSYYKTTQLQYPDVIEVDLDKKAQDDTPRISILPKGNNDLKSTPSFTVLTQPGDVEFYNETPGMLTVYLNKEGVDEFSFETSQQISVQSNSGGIWRFSEPGSYNWHGEVPTIIEGNEYELNTGGGILVLSDDMSDLSLEEQMETARMMLIASGLPITGMGQKGESDTLYISFSEAINEILPESRQYYLERAQNLIPFDIKIILDD